LQLLDSVDAIFGLDDHQGQGQRSVLWSCLVQLFCFVHKKEC
jgi:hypothetical protein